MNKHTAGKGYSVFVAAVAPLKAPYGAAHVPENGAADKVPTMSVRATSRQYYSCVLRHSTGPAASKVFMTPSFVSLTAGTANNVIKEMVVNTKVRQCPYPVGPMLMGTLLQFFCSLDPSRLCGL